MGGGGRPLRAVSRASLILNKMEPPMHSTTRSTLAPLIFPAPHTARNALPSVHPLPFPSTFSTPSTFPSRIPDQFSSVYTSHTFVYLSNHTDGAVLVKTTTWHFETWKTSSWFRWWTNTREIRQFNNVCSLTELPPLNSKQSARVFPALYYVCITMCCIIVYRIALCYSIVYYIRL